MWRFSGCVATEAQFRVRAGSTPTMRVVFDAARSELIAGAAIPSYAAGEPWDWTAANITIRNASNPAGMQSWDVRCRFGMRRADDGRRVGVTGRTRPRQLMLPEYTGVLRGIPQDLSQYLRWDSDDPFDIRLNLTGGPPRRQFNLEMQAVKYREARFRSRPGSLTSTDLPFTALDDARAGTPFRVRVRDGAPAPA